MRESLLKIYENLLSKPFELWHLNKMFMLIHTLNRFTKLVFLRKLSSNETYQTFYKTNRFKKGNFSGKLLSNKTLELFELLNRVIT